MEALFLSTKLHIGYLRSLEDSERVRAACVSYLQALLPFFHPQRPDIVEQASQLAATLGGRLESARLSWKYAWIQKAFGWPIARRSQTLVRRFRYSMNRFWEKTHCRFDRLASNASGTERF